MTEPHDQSFKMPASDANDYLEQAASLMKSSQVQQAIPLYENALASLERTYGEEQPELADCLNELGLAYEAGSRLTDALRIHTRRLRLGEKILGSADPAIVEILCKLTDINETLGRPADALFFCEQALQSAKQCIAQDSPLNQQIIDRYYHLSNLAGRPAHLQSQKAEKAPQQYEADSKPYQSIAEAGTSVPRPVSSNTDIPEASYAATGRDIDPDAAPAPAKVKTIRTRGMREDSKRPFSLGLSAKNIALPAAGLITVIALISFFVLQKPTEHKAAEPIAQDQSKTAIYTRYRTPDGSKEVRLLSSNLALLITGNNALEVPYIVTTSDWSGLGSALVNSVMEKQIWAEKRESALKTEDNLTYYSADGPEVLVMAKMARLAGNAQACFLRTGEYPKQVSNDMIGQFSFQNPVDGKETAIQIKTILDKSSDGQDAKASLESGFMPADEAANTPGKITCYASVISINEGRGLKLKATKFFVRGCDRDGTFLAAGRAGKTYVITASDAYLLAPEVSTSQRGDARNEGREGEQKSGKSSPKSKGAQPILPAVQKEKPAKATRLWIISNPPCPLLFIRCALPILLLGLALAAFIRSRMAAVDIKGRTTSSGSDMALILAAVCLSLALFALLAQFVIFA